MARITLQFTEEQVRVIKCLRFKKLEVKHERKDIINTIREIGAMVDNIDPGEDESQSDVGKETTHELCEMIHSGLNDIYNSAVRSKELAYEDSDKYYGFDMYDLFGGLSPYEFMAFALDMRDKVIPGTEEDYDGPKYPDDVIEKFDDVLIYIYERIVDIEDLLHQRCDCGGIQAGVKYIALDHERIWRTEEEFKDARKQKKKQDKVED